MWLWQIPRSPLDILFSENMNCFNNLVVFVSIVLEMRCIPRSLRSHLAKIRKIRWVQSEPENQRRHSSYDDLLLNCQKLPNGPILIYATEQMNLALPKLYPADRSHCLDLWYLFKSESHPIYVWAVLYGWTEHFRHVLSFWICFITVNWSGWRHVSDSRLAWQR